MKCLKISSRHDLPYNLVKYTPECLISILDKNASAPEVVKGFNGNKLILKFDDILSDEVMDHAPNIEHIFEIIRFAINNKGKTFVIHCTAGISRSSAVAFITEVISEGKDPMDTLVRLLDYNPNIFPNDRIIKLATRITRIDFFTPFNTLKHIMERRFASRLLQGDND